LFREIGVPVQEAACQFLVAQNAFLLAVEEGARVGNTTGLAKSAKEALDKSAKASEGAVRMARELLNSGTAGGQELLGYALSVQAQAVMTLGRPDDALRLADESVILFREVRSDVNEGSALLLSADALRATGLYAESMAAAQEALSLFQQAKYVRGEELANVILGFLEKIEEQREQQRLAEQQAKEAQAAATAAGAPQQPMKMLDFSQQQVLDAPPAQVAAMPRLDRDRGPALDTSGGLDLDTLKGKVLEIALRITGAEDEEIEADTPLMEAGLTSNSALLLRDELAHDLPGIQLPITLVFDYPSVAAMTDLIMETAQAKALKS